MTKKTINAGSHPVTWDKLQSAVSDINDNFDELYEQSNLTNVTASIVPSQDVAFDLGTPTKRFRDLYLSGSTIELGGTKISAAPGGGISVVGGVTSTTTSTGIIGLGKTIPGGYSGFFSNSVTVPAEFATADVVNVFFSYQFVSPPGPGGGRTLSPGEYSISGTTINIYVSPPGGTVAMLDVSAYNIYRPAIPPSTPAETWSADPGTIGPFPYGAELLSTAPEPTISSGDRATYNITYDGSDYLDTITLLTSGANYSIWDNYRIVELKDAAQTLTLLPIGTYPGPSYPRIISADNLRNTWPFSPGPHTATWTDGSRSVSIDYEIATYIVTGGTYYYARLISEGSYTVTGDFVGGDLFSDDAQTQVPKISFYIDYSNSGDPLAPTTLLPVTDWGTDGLGLTQFRIDFLVDRVDTVLDIFPVLGEVVTSEIAVPTSLADLGIVDGTTSSDVIAWDPGTGTWIKSTFAAVSGTDTIDDVLIRGSTSTRALSVGALTSSSLTVDGVAITGDWADITGKPTFSTVATSGVYSDLTGKPDLSVYQLSSSAFPGTWTALTGKPTFATVATSGAYADLSGKPTLATVATSGTYSDLSGRPSLAAVATSGSYIDLSNKPSIPTTLLNLGITDGTAGQVLTTNGSGGFSFTTVSGGSGTGLGSRVPTGGTTASLANNATGNITITGYKTYMLYKINTNAAAWVRFYITDAARSADASRSQGTDPSAGAGVVAEVITSGSETVIMSPGVLGYNDDATPTTNIYVAVTNLSGSTRTITVTATVIQLES